MNGSDPVAARLRLSARTRADLLGHCVTATSADWRQTQLSATGSACPPCDLLCSLSAWPAQQVSYKGITGSRTCPSLTRPSLQQPETMQCSWQRLALHKQLRSDRSMLIDLAVRIFIGDKT